MSPPLERRLLRHLRRSGLLPPGSRCLVALSGGGDSVALLHLLVRLRRALGLEVCAAHLDHGLRPEAADDRRFARRLCRDLGVPFLGARADVRALARRRGLSVEAAGRVLRYGFLREARRRLGADRVLTAHTADDQAETVLLRLVAGTGLRGLGGIRPRRRDGVVRPLLPFSREDLRTWLAARGLPWREDATNQVPEAPRTRVRLLLLPLLREWNPRVVQALGRVAAAAREDEGCLARQARLHLPDPPDRLELGALEALPRPVRRRLLREAAERRGARPERAHLLRLDRLEAGGALDLPGGVRARRTRTHLVLERPALPEPPPEPARFPAEPGEVELPGWGLRLVLREAPAPHPPEADRVWLDRRLLDGPLEVRGRRPGDRFRPAGGAGTAKLKKFLRERGVPLAERDRVPLLCLGDRVVWVLGHRADEGFLARDPGPGVLEVEVSSSRGARARPERSPGHPAEGRATMTSPALPPGPIVVDQETIQARVRDLAAEISRDYQGRSVHLLAVLRGAIPFLADLSRQLSLDVSFDFLAVTRDGPEGHVRLLKDLDLPLEGRTVLLVEDIVNEGTTLKYLLETLELRRPAEVKVCAMFDRPSRRRADVKPDYVGIVLDDRFVVGYGLDHRQIYRNLPYVAELAPRG